MKKPRFTAKNVPVFVTWKMVFQLTNDGIAIDKEMVAKLAAQFNIKEEDI